MSTNNPTMPTWYDYASLDGSAPPDDVETGAQQATPSITTDVYVPSPSAKRTIVRSGSAATSSATGAAPGATQTVTPAAAPAVPAAAPAVPAAAPAVPAAAPGTTTTTTTSTSKNTSATAAVPPPPVDWASRSSEMRAEAATMDSQLAEARRARKEAYDAQKAAFDKVPYRPLGFYTQLQTLLTPYKPPTAAEIQRNIKRERAQKIIAAVGDGISAIANLWGTSQGALNAYDGKETLSDRYASMYDKLRQDRRADQDRYMQAYLQGVAADDANAANIRANEQAKAALDANYANTTLADLQAQYNARVARADKLEEMAMAQWNTDRQTAISQEQFARTDETTRRGQDLSYRASRSHGGGGGGHRGGSSGGGGGSTPKVFSLEVSSGKGSSKKYASYQIGQTTWRDDKYIEDVYNAFSKKMISNGTKSLFRGRRSANDKRAAIQTLLSKEYNWVDKENLIGIMDQYSNTY